VLRWLEVFVSPVIAVEMPSQLPPRVLGFHREILVHGRYGDWLLLGQTFPAYIIVNVLTMSPKRVKGFSWLLINANTVP
jgi:hypothetical protein